MENGKLCALRQRACAVGAIVTAASMSHVDRHKAVGRFRQLWVDTGSCGTAGSILPKAKVRSTYLNKPRL
jgi:hypothetical protein